MNKYYPGELFNIHIQSSIRITQEKNWVLPLKKGKGKLPLFCCNLERLIPIYALYMIANFLVILPLILDF